jgi:hypothetical protein
MLVRFTSPWTRERARSILPSIFYESAKALAAAFRLARG